jgi:excisionase family DNA binding protein
MDTITISTTELHSFAARIAQITKDELIRELKSAGIILSENEAKEYRKFKLLNEKLINQHDAAVLLGVSDQTVMRMKDKGDLPFTTLNSGRVRFRQSDILALKRQFNG